jgi:hypothetical protein
MATFSFKQHSEVNVPKHEDPQSLDLQGMQKEWNEI